MTMWEIVHLVLGIAILAVLALKLVLCQLGREKVVVYAEKRTPFVLLEREKNRMTVETEVDIANEGKQCATIMDAIVRVQLPYEQYDGIRAWGKAELVGAPREDDYFEAVLIQKREQIRVKLMVTLEARKGMTLEEAMKEMVDFPIEFIYLETGRMPCHYSKVRIEILGDELRALVGKGESNG